MSAFYQAPGRETTLVRLLVPKPTERSVTADAPRNPQSSFRLTAWFGLVSLFCIAGMSVFSSIVLSRFLSDTLLKHDADTMMEVLQGIVEIQKPGTYFPGSANGAADRTLEEFFVHIAKLPDVLRANIYATDQRVLWSSDLALIGRDLGPNRELEEALSGAVTIESGKVDKNDIKPEHSALKGHVPRYVESYLPVRSPSTGKVVGVVELYRVPNSLFAAIDRGIRLVWISATCAGLLLYLALFGLVRRADRLLEEQRTRLLESETLAVIGEMTGAIAHGIRNPLASIRSSAELLQEEASAESQRTAQDIMAQVDRLSEWVRQLLTYSDREPARLQSVDLPDVVRRCLEGVVRECERRGVTIDYADQALVPHVRGEPVRLLHVLNSIVANALEAMPDGGALQVRVGNAAGGRVSLVVRDTGIGVTGTDLPRVFAPFFTTKRKGLGLGLPLVKRIVTRFGGSVAFTSAPGQGSAVEIELLAYS
jgi:signal transduction histidine kinase